jgi:quercetin dioxygenase-like cupin family protein/DNA-binding beta-propeller fold protein YncE
MLCVRSLRRCFELLVLSTLLSSGSRRLEAKVPPPEPNAGISRKLLDKRAVVGAMGLETQLWLIEYGPGASAPAHQHPVAGIGYVVEGEFESAFGAEPLVHVGAGQSFVDPANVEHRVFRNASSERRLKFLVAYTIPSGTPIVQSASAARVRLEPNPRAISISRPGLYPETIVVNPRTKKFLVGSVREGAVYEVGLDGKAKELVHDERLISILGLAADPGSNRLLVTNSDLGAGIRHSARGPKQEAAIGIYDLTTGRRLDYVDLATLLPDEEHLINGIALDSTGNAYVTDSLAPAIYKINTSNQASLFLEDAEFRGPGVNLNGIVYHPKGFLLVVKKSTGALYRVPLDEPGRFARVKVPTQLVGADGLLLASSEQLVLIANKTPAAVSESVFVLESTDDWNSAQVVDSRKLGGDYPTTGVALDGKLYALSSHLDEWLGATNATREALAKRARQAEIRALGVLTTVR